MTGLCVPRRAVILGGSKNSQIQQPRMQIYSMTKLLADSGLSAPNLHVLNPSYDNYTALLLQPQGEIVIDGLGFRNAKEESHSQYAAFLADASTEGVGLAVTPEYSTPWKVIQESLLNGVVPAEGSLWVIGGESITQRELETFECTVANVATVLHETLPPATGRFLDPVVYIFKTQTIDAEASERLVIVVQFKTSPLADDDQIEVDGLQLGTLVYKFGSGTDQLCLATIICSDALAFQDEHARAMYDRTLIIHIQLNPKPRQSQFRMYRSKLMGFPGDQTELICLNWAQNVRQVSGETSKCWGNISGSAWYLRPSQFDTRDETLTANHRNGLYYTWLQDLRCHALFFNYGPAVFSVRASKVAHIGGTGTLSRRRGPRVQSTRVWDASNRRWTSDGPVDDGFSSIVHECGAAQTDVANLVAENPFSVERALALAAGKIDKYEWYSLRELDSTSIDATEIMKRVTACQDSDKTASQFRTARLRMTHRVVSLLKESLPAVLEDLKSGFTFGWWSISPHTNIVSSNHRRATVIYLGDGYADQDVRDVADRAADHIGRWASDADAIVEGKQRLCVWYRNIEGVETLFEPTRYVAYDKVHTVSPYDIGGEE